MNELSEVARDIESFVEAGRRVPSTIWEKYDRINKRHKKHGEITTVAAELRSKTRRRRRVIKQEHTDKQHANETDECRTCSGGDGMSAGSRHLPSRLLIDSREPVSSLLFRGGGSCTFGSGRGDKEPRKMLSRRSAHAHVKKWKASPSLWGPYERKKMNELCKYFTVAGTIILGGSLWQRRYHWKFIVWLSVIFRMAKMEYNVTEGVCKQIIELFNFVQASNFSFDMFRCVAHLNISLFLYFLSSDP